MRDNKRLNDSGQQKRRILTPKERQERNRQEMIDAILDAAQDIMREEGVGDLNLQEVARRVGIQALSLYTYFPNKMAIYEAVFERGMRMFREGMLANLEKYGATLEGQEATMIYFMTFSIENPELFHLLFERPVPGFVPSEAGLEEGRKLIEHGAQAIQQQMAAGEIDPSIPVAQARDLFVALTHGLTALHMANEPHLPVGEGRFGSLIPLAMKALELVYQHGISGD